MINWNSSTMMGDSVLFISMENLLMKLININGNRASGGPSRGKESPHS